MESLRLEGLVYDFYDRGPAKVDRETLTGAARVRADQWAAWWMTRWLILGTVPYASVPAGHHPHLLAQVRQLLRNSPNLQPERQRARILAYVAADRKVRATRTPKWRRARKKHPQ